MKQSHLTRTQERLELAVKKSMSKVSAVTVLYLLVEVNSAMGFEDKKRINLYQLEWEFNSEPNGANEQDSPAKERKDPSIRPVSVYDYNEYRKLEDKKDRIVLKKDLYNRKKTMDGQKIVVLQESLIENSGEKKLLAQQIEELHRKLQIIKGKTEEIDFMRIKEV